MHEKNEMDLSFPSNKNSAKHYRNKSKQNDCTPDANYNYLNSSLTHQLVHQSNLKKIKITRPSNYRSNTGLDFTIQQQKELLSVKGINYEKDDPYKTTENSINFKRLPMQKESFLIECGSDAESNKKSKSEFKRSKINVGRHAFTLQQTSKAKMETLAEDDPIKFSNQELAQYQFNSEGSAPEGCDFTTANGATCSNNKSDNLLANQAMIQKPFISHLKNMAAYRLRKRVKSQYISATKDSSNNNSTEKEIQLLCKPKRQ